MATDLLYHSFAHMMIVLGPQFPGRVTASGGQFVHKEKREVPDTYLTTITYPSEQAIFLFSTGASEHGIEEVYRGQEGSLGAGFSGKGPLKYIPDKPFKKLYDERKGKGLFDIPANPHRPDHMSNFLECVRTRKKTHCNEDVGYKTMVAIGLGVQAYRRNKVMLFDPKTERVSEA